MSRDSLRVLFLTQTYPRYPDDTAGPFIRDLAVGLARGGDRVTVLVPHAKDVADSWQERLGEPGSGPQGSVDVRSFRYAPESLERLGYGRSLEKDETVRAVAGAVTPLYLAGLRRAVAHELSRTRYDLVHAHWVVPNGVAALGVRRLRRGDPPLAIGLHGSDVFLAEKPGVRAIVGATLRRSRLLTGCSPELVERVRKLGFEGSLHRVIPYGVDVETYSPGPTASGAWRDRLGIGADAVVALGVGRMATKKGFHVLMAASQSLLGTCPDLHLILAGSGDRLAEWRALADAFPAELAGRVHFPGLVEKDTLPDLYRAADLFVLPAVHDGKGNVDGLPNVILEAMASGLPVVATSVSGIPLAIENGTEGRLVEEGDVEGLVDAVAALYRSSELRARAGAAARRRVETELTWSSVAARYREAYLECLGRAS